jgi:hypothetical protein
VAKLCFPGKGREGRGFVFQKTAGVQVDFQKSISGEALISRKPSNFPEIDWGCVLFPGFPENRRGVFPEMAGMKVRFPENCRVRVDFQKTISSEGRFPENGRDVVVFRIESTEIRIAVESASTAEVNEWAYPRYLVTKMKTWCMLLHGGWPAVRSFHDVADGPIYSLSLGTSVLLDVPADFETCRMKARHRRRF